VRYRRKTGRVKTPTAVLFGVLKGFDMDDKELDGSVHEALRAKVPRQPARLDGELWGVTTYFNPVGYGSKSHHLRLFSERVRKQGLKLMVVELAFGEGAHVLDETAADRVIHLRSDSVLWQKERLLNIAITQLPDNCDKVAWLDADILFENDAWVAETKQLLRDFTIVQPFHTAWLLPPNYTSRPPSKDQEEGAIVWSSVYAHHSGLALTVGHPGLAWAARRSLLETHGVYDRAVLGGADVVQALAMFGLVERQEIRDRLKTYWSESQFQHLTGWAKRFHEDVRGSVFYTAGSVLHLWHGNLQTRQYLPRQLILKAADFNPLTDIRFSKNLCWEWSSDKPDLHQKVKDYFGNRREETVGAS
jgi:hypothetical protein